MKRRSRSFAFFHLFLMLAFLTSSLPLAAPPASASEPTSSGDSPFWLPPERITPTNSTLPPTEALEQAFAELPRPFAASKGLAGTTTPANQRSTSPVDPEPSIPSAELLRPQRLEVPPQLAPQGSIMPAQQQSISKQVRESQIAPNQGVTPRQDIVTRPTVTTATPRHPTPITQPSKNATTSITADSGGSAVSPGGLVTLSIDRGVVQETMHVIVQDLEEGDLPPNFVLMGPWATFIGTWASGKPATILGSANKATGDTWSQLPAQSAAQATIQIPLTAVQQTNTRLSIARRDPGTEKWEILPTSLDGFKQIAMARTDRLGTFALVENAARWSTPASGDDSAQIKAIGDEVIVDEWSSGFQHLTSGSGGGTWSDVACGSGGCWEDHAYWTHNRANDLEDSGVWTPPLTEAGYYYVSAFIPAANATTTGANYQVHHGGEVDSVVVNQLVISGAWKNIGAFWFNADGSEYVLLTDEVPETGTYASQIAYDAVKFTYAGLEEPPPVDLIPPVIHHVDRWLDNTHAVIRAKVTDNVAVAEVVLIFNGTSVTMSLIGDDLYEAVVPVPVAQTNQFQVIAVDTSGNVATFPRGSRINIRGYLSRNLGSYNFKNGGDDCNVGCKGTTRDPVNSDPSSGNFTETVVDLTVTGIGDTAIQIERTYNGLPNEPQGILRYTEDESGALVEEPFDIHPEPFGTGWNLGTVHSLLVLDNALLRGVQVRFADGHTVDFARTGDSFTPLDTRNYDSLKVHDGGYLLTRRDRTQHQFDAEGHEVTRIDRNGNTIIFTYEGEKLVKAQNSAGRVVTFAYNAKGQLTDIYAPEGLHLQYAYTDDVLTTYTDARGNTWTYTYNGEKRLTSIITPKGHPHMQLTYDAAGRTTEQIIGATEVYRLDYNLESRTTVIRDTYDRPTTHVYDDRYRLIEDRDALGRSEVYAYNDRDERISFMDRAGRRWSYTYDNHGNRLTEQGPLDWHREWQYNAFNRPTFFKDALDRTWTWTYDQRGNVITMTNPLGDTSSTTYDNRGLPVKVTNFNDATITNTYDATTGNLLAVTDAEGHTTAYTYDTLGRIKTLTDANGQTYTHSYDANGHLIALHGPLSYQLGFAYDPNNNLVKEIDPNGGETTYVYDGSEWLTDTFNQLGHQTSFGYDALGHLTTSIDPEHRVTTYEYNAVYDQVAIHTPEDTHTHKVFDAVGNVMAETDPEGRTTRYLYDALNRLVERTQHVVDETPADATTNVRTRYEYDTVGNLTRLVDGNTNPIVYQYDALDRLIRSTNAEQETTSYTYDGEGNLIRRTNPRMYSTTWTYDGNNRVIAMRDAADNLTHSVYDPNGNLTHMIDAHEVVTRHEYDALNRRITTVQNERPGQSADAETNVTTRLSYDLAGNLIKQTDPRGNATTYGYDAAHRHITTTDAQQSVTTITYDKVNNVLDVEDAEQHHRSFAYDDLNRLVSATDAEQHAQRYQYDKVGNLLVLTNPRGYATSYTYDALNRPITIVDAKQGQVRMAYDAMGNRLALTDQNTHTDRWTYDRVYRMLSYTDAENHRTAYAYDDNGNQIEVVDGNKHSTHFTYTVLDQLERVTNAEDETTTYRYNKVGKLTHKIDADGVTTRYSYDPLYRLAVVSLNDRPGAVATVDINVTNRYSYDAASNLVAITDPRNNVSRFEFDSLNRAVKETNALGNVWTSTYDKAGNLSTYLDANDHLTRYTRDADYLVTRVDYFDRSFVTFEYDENHNRTHMTDGLGTSSWSYDELDREVLATDALDRSFAQSYDPVGNRLTATCPDGRKVSYSYFRNDWMKTVTDPRGHTTTYERDGVSSITRAINPNSTVAEMEYDKANRLLKIVNQQVGYGNHLISAYTYTLDDVGQRIKAVQQYGWRNPATVVESYRYDPLRRVVAVENDDNDYRATYTYDAAGNRTRWAANDDLGTQTPRDSFAATYLYNAVNQLLSATIDSDLPPSNRSYTFRYDRNGNRINSEWNGPQGTPVQGSDYHYDPENRVVQALNYQRARSKRVDRDVTRMFYDGLGRRLVKEHDPKNGNGGTKRHEYTFDDLDPVAEYDMWDHQHRNFYRGSDNRLVSLQLFRADDAEGLMSWYHYDGLGSVSGLTRHQGQSTHNYRYDVYGTVYPDHGNFVDPHNHYTYTGQEWDDETNMLHFYARDYDPNMGVWLQQDPYRGRLLEPQSLHRYGFVQGNPVNYVDAYGFATTEEFKPLSTEYWGYAQQAAKEFGVPAEFVAAVVIAEQTHDYGYEDAVEDLVAKRALVLVDTGTMLQDRGMMLQALKTTTEGQEYLDLLNSVNSSLGLGQVQISTARSLWSQLNDSTKDSSVYQLVKQLEDPRHNIRYVGAYLRQLMDSRARVEKYACFPLSPSQRLQIIYGGYRAGPSSLWLSKPGQIGSELSPTALEYYRTLQQ